MCARPSKETSLEGCFVSQQQRGQQSGFRRGQLGGPKGGQLGGLKRGQLAGLKGGQLEASGGVNSEAFDQTQSEGCAALAHAAQKHLYAGGALS